MKDKYIILILLLICLLPITNVNAQEAFYINANGVELNENQYNNLVGIFGEKTLYSMGEGTLNLIKDETEFHVSNESKYVKVETISRNGTVVDIIETEIQEDDIPNHSIAPVTTYGWNTTHETSMKRLNMQVVSPSFGNVRVVTLTNTWISNMPTVRSFDVIAVRLGAYSATLSPEAGSVSGYQAYNGGLQINYSQNGTNTIIDDSFGAGTGGIGISMNIVDDVVYGLENSMTVTFLTPVVYDFPVYGTYQHATSTVTLAQSQNYNFSSNGLGRVLNFASSVKGKYDNMQGVYLEYDQAEEIYG